MIGSTIQVDNLDGLAGTPGSNLTSALGNNFVINSGGNIQVSNITNGTMSGTNLRANRSGSEVSFTWNLNPAADAFGFNGIDNDGGIVTVNFISGGAVSYALASGQGSSDNLFWGISGLAGIVSSIMISTTDPGGVTNWDNFTTAQTVPIPAPLALFLTGLAGLGFIARRRRKV